ncbi:MAG: polysaccharide biosynthesis tyrosine autokinase, partial [Bacteroidota bacterium]
MKQLQNQKIDINELNTFDIKEYFFKILDHWKLFVVTILLGLIIANIVNRRTQKIYNLKSIITVKDEQNPLFASSTNIAFNWGGPSDQVETIITILQSRTHNEKVVNQLKYYVDYLKEGRYRKEDVYGDVPFVINVDTSSYQLLGKPIQIDFLNDNKISVSVEFDEEAYRLINYKLEDTKSIEPNSKTYNAKFIIGEMMETPFFNFSINKDYLNQDLTGKTFFVRFNSFNGIVNRFSNIDVSTLKKGTSLIQLSLNGPNKKKIQDYINATVEVLDRDQRKQKIQYALKTKEYIDTLFQVESKNLKNIETDLGTYKQRNDIYDLSAEGTNLLGEATALDNEAQQIRNRLDYYKNLETYIRARNQYDENIPAPALVDIEDPNISKSVGTLISLSKAKENMELTVKPSYPPLKKINEEISLEREYLLEHIASMKSTTKSSLNNVNKRIAKNNSKLRTLSPKEQKLLNFQRKYNITEANYNYLKQKSYEAGTAIAANVSDIKVLDKAKDTGQMPIKPKGSFNYLIGLMLGTILPLLFIVTKEVLDNKLNTVEEIEKTYKIPVLGVLGKNNYKNRLVVFNEPNSTFSESFRALRSNIQFLFKRDSKTKTIVVTSSVSKEGKTMTAINMATVFALSGKKTILLGFDLRKPKLHEDFEFNNEIGVVNYLIGEKSLDEVIRKSEVENLDVITSGPMPPNPSELILSDSTDELFKKLSEKYDYIVIDTPPVGLVADALELFKFSDAIIY